MDQLERRDLPGNDASWYRAMLVDDEKAEEAVSEPEQTTLDVDPAPRPEDEQPPEETPTPEVTPTLGDQPLPAATEEDPSAPELAEPTDDAEPESTDDSLVVRAPHLTGDTDPVHFPDEELPSEQLPAEPPAEPPTQEDQESEPVVEEIPEPSAAPMAAVPPLTDTSEDLEPVADDAIDNTSEMVGQLWTSQEPASPLDDWEPDAMDRKMTSRRPFRWTSLIGAVAVIGLIVVGLVVLPSLTRDRADDHRDMMTTALFDLRAELPDTQTSLQTATEPSATNPALNDLSTQLTVLTAKASAVDDAGRASLPSAPPFTSSAPIDELEPIQQRLEPLATTAQTIQRRIANVVQYRTLMSGFMALPELPAEADPATQADLRVALASAQAESASILSDLPSDVSLSAHEDLARSLNETFGAWQIDYLEALRTEDPVVAERLVTELQTALTELDGELVNPLAQIRRQTDTDLIDLARAIDEVMALASSDG